jgi:AcrR family transcriptional regulator
MAPPVRTPPSKWIEEGLRALAAGGPDAVRVEALARALGVTKGGFYSHFDDRPALLEEMLESWERLVVDEVIVHVEAEGGDARTKLRRLFAMTRPPAGDLIDIELAMRDWARRDRAVAKRIARLDNRRMEYLRALFSEFCSDPAQVEMRCLVTLGIFIGVPSVAIDLSKRRRRQLVEMAHEWLLDG